MFLLSLGISFEWQTAGGDEPYRKNRQEQHENGDLARQGEARDHCRYVVCVHEDLFSDPSSIETDIYPQYQRITLEGWSRKLGKLRKLLAAAQDQS